MVDDRWIERTVQESQAETWGAVHGQAVFVRDFLLVRWPWLGWVVFVGTLAAMAVGAVGVAIGLTRERWLPPLLVLALFAWLFVLLLRDATPAWMAYAPMTVLAALLALGWTWCWPATPWGFPGLSVLEGGAVAVNCASLR